ncbi:MAG: ABC transporter ATP-binding protein, partial [Lentilactobacillus hilgardii]
MEENYKVKVQNVTKEYDLFKTQSEKLRSFFAISKHKIPHFCSHMGISFSIQTGETLGFICV